MTHSRRTFQQALDPRNNSLNAIRLALATLVIVSHAAPIGGFGSDPQWHYLKLGTACVGGFFAISGYLITGSRERRTLLPYLWARALRITPALWVCLVLTAFVIAPLISIRTGRWSLAGALAYLPGNMLLSGGKQTIGTVLQSNPLSGAMNGSLWTLRYEVMCYIGLGIAVLVRPLWRRRSVVLASFVALTALSWFVLHADPSRTGGIYNPALLMPFFLAGVVLYRYADVVPCADTIGVAAVAVLAIVTALGYGTILTALPVAYITMWLGVRLPAFVRRVGSKNDISYGMYVYAFPLQQLLTAWGVSRGGYVAYTICSIVLTIPFAAASWFAVERPAMRLKAPALRGGVATPQGKLSAVEN